MHGESIFYSGVAISCPISLILRATSVDLPCGQKGQVYILTIGGESVYLIKSEKMRSKSLFENKVFEKSCPRAFRFLGSRPTVNMCSDTISVAT